MTKLAGYPVVATIAVTDMAAAREFYGETLGLEQVDENPGGVTFMSGGYRVFVYEAPTGGKNPASSVTWEVQDLEAIVEELKAAGVIFEHYDGFPFEWQGDIAIMGEIKTAWCKDPSGNTLAIAQVL